MIAMMLVCTVPLVCPTRATAAAAADCSRAVLKGSVRYAGWGPAIDCLDTKMRTPFVEVSGAAFVLHCLSWLQHSRASSLLRGLSRGTMLSGACTGLQTHDFHVRAPPTQVRRSIGLTNLL